MRNLYLMAFTKNGEKTAKRIAKAFRGDPGWTVHADRIASPGKFVAPIFNRDNVLVFVGAAAIAVRIVAPFLQSKTTDPPVIVVDEPGRFVIPILSGHIGGANRIAEQIARAIEAVAVITTATDLHDVFAVDVFAVENGCAILNPEMIKTVSSRLLENKRVGLSTEAEVVGSLPENVVLKMDGKIGIYIGLNPDKNPFEKTLRLIPKCFHVGIGCRKGINAENLHEFFIDMLKSHHIPIEAVGSLSSIVLKKDEEAIRSLSKHYRIPFRTYTKEELRSFEHLFDASDFVRSKTGTGNVCEISAWLSSNKGEVVLNKTIRSGMTLAIAKEPWQVRFALKEHEKKESIE